jgi:class 3 adenylate cyclase/YHS domain-containing protein
LPEVAPSRHPRDPARVVPARDPSTGDPVEATFAFVDLAGFTALTEAHGDRDAVVLLERFEGFARQALAPSDRLVKTLGDAVMLAFEEPGDALDATERLFQALVAEPAMPMARAGLHHGAAIERGGDFFGSTVNLAARVASLAQGGQILATAAVADVARGRGARVTDLGPYELRNMTMPVELFDLGLFATPTDRAVDPVCRMHIARADAAGRLRHEDSDYWFCSLACAARFAADPTPFASPRDRAT